MMDAPNKKEWYEGSLWHDSWDIEHDGSTEWQLRLAVHQSPTLIGGFVASMLILTWEKTGPGNGHDDWTPEKPLAIHVSEHLSVPASVKALKKAARIAELLRVGPEH